VRRVVDRLAVLVVRKKGLSLVKKRGGGVILCSYKRWRRGEKLLLLGEKILRGGDVVPQNKKGAG